MGHTLNETTQKVTASTGTLGNRRLEVDRPIALAVGSGDDLSGCEGERPRELN